MMEKEFQDKGIRKVMQESKTFRLPSNFTYCTMRKVEEAARMQEKKQERRMFWAIVLVSFLLVVGGVGLIVFYLGNEGWKTFVRAFSFELSIGSSATLWWVLAVLVFILILFDYGMRRAYFKHHQSKG